MASAALPAPVEDAGPVDAATADSGLSEDAGAPSDCPAEMVSIDGDYCPLLDERCTKKRKPWQCAEFQEPTICKSTPVHRHYCIDRYEYPNRAGALPDVMISWVDAGKACASIGKRLCTEAEWTLACEGPARLPFPYGYSRDATVCAIDKPSPPVSDQRLFSSRTQADELARLDQREPSGSRAGCVSAFGVHDLTGSVDEWVVNESGQPYKSSLKGGNWGEYRNACRPVTRGHAEGFYYYQIGFRCCKEAATPPP